VTARCVTGLIGQVSPSQRTNNNTYYHVGVGNNKGGKLDVVRLPRKALFMNASSPEPAGYAPPKSDLAKLRYSPRDRSAMAAPRVRARAAKTMRRPSRPTRAAANSVGWLTSFLTSHQKWITPAPAMM